MLLFVFITIANLISEKKHETRRRELIKFNSNKEEEKK